MALNYETTLRDSASTNPKKTESTEAKRPRHLEQARLASAIRALGHVLRRRDRGHGRIAVLQAELTAARGVRQPVE